MDMKRAFLVSLVFCSFLVFVNSASAFFVDVNSESINVGSKDSLVASAFLANSGDNTELGWAQTVLGDTGITLDIKYTNQNELGNWNWIETNEAGIWALNLLVSPEYFYIKTGVKRNEINHFLFQNNSSLDWAVVDLDDLNITNEGKISHLGELNGTQVPEPTTALLIGLGLVGIAGVRRKFKV